MYMYETSYPTSTSLAGGYLSESSTFLMNLEDMTWRAGPDLPYGMNAPGYVQYKDSVLLVGGQDQ